MASALAAALIPVTVALDWTPNTNHLGLYAAKANGTFAKYNLDVSMVQMKQTSTTQLVGAGRADFGISFVSDILHAREQKIPVVSVAGIIPHNTSCFAWRKSTPISSVKDFEKKRYGGWGSPEEVATLRYLMQKSGAKFESLKMVTTGVSDFLPTTARNADFMWIYMGWDGIRARLEGVPINTLCVEDLDPVFQHPSPLLITSEATAQKKTDMVRNFLKAASEGYRLAAEKPSEASALFLKMVPESDKKLVEESSRFLAKEFLKNIPHWGYQDPQQFERYKTWANNNKILSLNETAAQFVRNDLLPPAPQKIETKKSGRAK